MSSDPPLRNRGAHPLPARARMRAVVHDRFGPPEVLRIEEVEQPAPKADEVLVRVRAATVTQTDCHMRRARPFVWRLMLGLRRPKRRILGLDGMEREGRSRLKAADGRAEVVE